ncbi:MAG TPA: leucyl/phenylalanyl-tRNA--protein transferase [Chitinophagaceae bacterium]|nr:leucyl/phenylalanyl-tRNA--protein transferase [Chitinophagaceae bacterium]
MIRACKQTHRVGQDGTWITDEMEQAYSKLHQLGHAESAECWRGDTLVGGLYGVRVGNVFCGESMFSLESNASKFAFIQFVQVLKAEGIKLIDCQVYTPHLESLGACYMSRDEFVQYLNVLHP